MLQISKIFLDAAYLDNSAYKTYTLTAWIPLLDATEENGCLQVCCLLVQLIDNLGIVKFISNTGLDAHESALIVKFAGCVLLIWYPIRINTFTGL